MNYWFRLMVTGLLLSQTARAQGIQFEAGRWADVLKKAAADKKLIFVHVDANPAVCQQCIDVASQGFSNPALREKFGLYFLSYRVPFNHPDRRGITEQYDVSGVPVSLYLDPAGDLLFRQPGSTSFAMAYLENAERALREQIQTPLSTLTANYAAKPADRGALAELVRKRQALGLSYDALLDTYADLARNPASRGGSASAEVIAFIFEREPPLHTKAFAYVFSQPRSLIDSLYRRAGGKRAAEIDNQIILKSRQEAIRQRNTDLAVQTAQFAVGAHGRKEQTGQAGYKLTMMEYYRATRDTARFLQTAASYYDLTYMTQPVDSLLKADRSQTALEPGPGLYSVTIPAAPPKPAKQNFPESFVYRPPSQDVANELNRGAYQVYQMGRTVADWQKALTWSERSLALRADNPGFLDTYAHLLYRLNRREEAVQTQQRAIALAPARRMRTGTLEAELAKMKLGTL